MPPRALRITCLLLLALSSSCSTVQRERGTRVPAIEQAHAAWKQIATDGSQLRAISVYRQGVEDVVKELTDAAPPDRWPAAMSLRNGWTVRVDQGGKTPEVWTPKLFDEFDVPRQARPSPVNGAVRSGVGLPVNGVRVDENEDEHSRFVYQKNQHLPVTAVLEFNSDAALKHEATLHLYDPREVRNVKVGARRIPLAADFSTPVHAVLDERSFWRKALGGLFRPERFMDEKGLYIQEPYRADKVPVVFVHGLASDPHIWENEVVALMSDPEIGPKVQCWCFMYPTGLPVPVSAARLRASLGEAEKTFDPDNNDPGLKKMMLVGHSMGGLLSRLQVIDSGNAFWNTLFAVPPEKVPLDGEVSQRLRAALLFKADPHVKRVVFIATPHRGSEMADGWVGRLGSKLIRAPLQIVQAVTSIATLDVAMLNPARLNSKTAPVDSIYGLSTKHPVLEVMASRPIKVPFHSIIAVVRDKPKLEDTTDGYVPYVSSHLAGAETQTIVKAGHSCTRNPATVQAVVKLVRHHLGLNYVSARATSPQCRAPRSCW